MSTKWSYNSKSEKCGIIKSIILESKLGQFMPYYKWIINFYDNTSCDLNELKPSIILKMSLKDAEAVNEAKRNNNLLIEYDTEYFRNLHRN